MFEQLYNLEGDEPKPEYSKLYEEVKNELENMGLDFDGN